MSIEITRTPTPNGSPTYTCRYGPIPEAVFRLHWPNQPGTGVWVTHYPEDFAHRGGTRECIHAETPLPPMLLLPGGYVRALESPWAGVIDPTLTITTHDDGHRYLTVRNYWLGDVHHHNTPGPERIYRLEPIHWGHDPHTHSDALLARWPD
jgi:hypothetical protein